ncbi:uncharacterized protein LOC136750168 [Amia ocellicauda]|uniref:uncharacterized protein LOC136750168 n=1 Tax=Amia ocellicauda TaxID=2972642 RepID=UPI0034647F12
MNYRKREKAYYATLRSASAALPVADLFSCAECGGFVQPPILQCRAGHLICRQCRPKLRRCPGCWSRLKSSARNLAMDKLAAVLGLPCEERCSVSAAAALSAQAAEVTDLLECPACFHFVMPPIVQCQAGHLICQQCRPKLRRCPACEGSLEVPIRNLALEKVAATLPIPSEVDPEWDNAWRQFYISGTEVILKKTFLHRAREALTVPGWRRKTHTEVRYTLLHNTMEDEEQIPAGLDVTPACLDVTPACLVVSPASLHAAPAVDPATQPGAAAPATTPSIWKRARTILSSVCSVIFRRRGTRN